MTSHAGRLYALAATLVVFFLTWAVVAARPWANAKPDPRVTALAQREQRLRHDAALVRTIVRRRWATYRVQLAQRRVQIAAAQTRQRRLGASAAAPNPVNMAASGGVRVVDLPPLTITRTS